MKQWPDYERTTLETNRKGVTTYHVQLRCETECGNRVTGKASHELRDVAEAKAFRKMTEEHDASVLNCIRRGKHNH